MRAPIEPQDYVYGVKVVDIGDARVKRGKTRRPPATCAHLHMVYDPNERRVWCDDCESEVESFDAFVVLVGNYHKQAERHRRREEAVQQAEQHSLISRAAKVMDAAWRKHRTAPMCPHCDKALLPDDVVQGVAECSKALAYAQRKRAQPPQAEE